MFSLTDLRQLIDQSSGPCVSLYMPTHSSGRERQQDEIRLKNLLQKAGQQLEGVATSRQARAMLKRIEQLPHEAELWRHRSNGLAAFVAPEFERFYSFAIRMPEMLTVSDRFFVSPVLPSLEHSRRYFVLALTKDSAHLYEGHRQSLVALELPSFEAVTVDENERTLQYHAHRAPAQGRGKTDEAIYHGQGGPDEREKADLFNYFKRQIDPAVSDLLRGHRAPLVVACVDYLAPIYHKANTYPHLAEQHVSGSPTELGLEELGVRAWHSVEPALRRAEQAAIDKYEDSIGKERASDELDQILTAAGQGRVETLLVAEPELSSLTFGSRSDKADPNAENPAAAVVEEVVVETLLHGGSVLALDQMPSSTGFAAVFRY
jgi:Bacterial archaeo-eukaryotic release factor family 3